MHDGVDEPGYAALRDQSKRLREHGAALRERSMALADQSQSLWAESHRILGHRTAAEEEWEIRQEQNDGQNTEA